MSSKPLVPTVAPGPELGSARWSYDEAFSRHRGLFSPQDQERLRNSRVAVAGLGGVGGVHLVTLSRSPLKPLPG